jgi:hypothetical protein
MSIREQALNKIREKWSYLSPEKRAVVAQIGKSTTPITQKQIAKSEDWIGSHPTHEGWNGETTTRMVREVIRQLRVVHSLPILSSRDGYWLPETVQEIDEFLAIDERQVRARNQSSLETYRALRRSCNGIAPRSYFEDLPPDPDEPPPSTGNDDQPMLF